MRFPSRLTNDERATLARFSAAGGAMKCQHMFANEFSDFHGAMGSNRTEVQLRQFPGFANREA
jgi:hypothetical protein